MKKKNRFKQDIYSSWHQLKNNCIFPIKICMKLQFDNILVNIQNLYKKQNVKYQMAEILPSLLNHFGHTTENNTMQFFINQ